MLSGVVSAGTVTITGSCKSTLLPGNIINFTLINSGNDTAYNLLLNPVVQGAKSLNSHYAISALSPNQLTPVNVLLGNVTGRGTFVDSFVLFYQQGASTFSALFPCVIDMGTGSQSELYLSTNTVESNGVATVNVTVTNGANQDIAADVSVLFPPEFTFASPSSYLVNLGPFASKSLKFALNSPSLQGSFTGIAIAQYQLNGTNYAGYANLLVASAVQAAKSPVNYALYAVLVIIIAIILMIVRSALRNKKRDKKDTNNADGNVKVP